MTLINTTTGEITEPMPRADAERLTSRIGYMAQSVADGMDKLLTLIAQARAGGAHVALGYESWTAYVASEFSDILPRLDREPRRELVRELASHGMSTRAIAPVVGVTHETVAQDIKAPVRNLTPETPQGGATDAPEAAEPVDTAPRVPRPPVTGIDGKTYTPPARPRLDDDEDIRRASERRAGIASLESVVTFLDPRTRTPRQMAESYADVLDEFDADVLDRSAATLTAIADLKKETR